MEERNNLIDHILIDRKWHSGIVDVCSWQQAADCDIDHCLVV
jgi:hypothetical protein